jgi:hypothetical protein
MCVAGHTALTSSDPCRYVSSFTTFAVLMLYALAVIINLFACLMVFLAKLAGWVSLNLLVVIIILRMTE